MKSSDPLGAKKTFIRKKLGHTTVSAIKASSVTFNFLDSEEGGPYLPNAPLSFQMMNRVNT